MHCPQRTLGPGILLSWPPATRLAWNCICPARTDSPLQNVHAFISPGLWFHDQSPVAWSVCVGGEKGNWFTATTWSALSRIGGGEGAELLESLTEGLITMLNTNTLHCTFRRVGDTLIAHVCTSQIDDDMARHLVNEIKQRIEAGPDCEHLTIDCHQVQQAGSSCLSMCLELNNLMEIHGGSTVITGLNPHLDWLFRSVQLDKVLHVA